jgi:hypothetical protein
MTGRIVKGLAALLAGGGAAVAVAAGGAGGPTTVGDAGFHINSAVYDGVLAVQAKDQTGLPSYQVPAGGGVVTSWSLQLLNATADGDVTLKVVQPLGPDTYKVVGESVGHILNGDRFRTFATRIAVNGGERLGMKTPPGSTIMPGSAGQFMVDPGDVRATNGDATVGQTFTTSEFAQGAYMALSAVVEPDADHDQFGDLSQDSCPADPDRHVAPCVTSLASALTASAASVAQGDVVMLTGTEQASLGTAVSALGTMVLPAGLQPVYAASSGGNCTIGDSLSCPFGDLAPGSTGTMVVAARAVGHGEQVVSMGGSSGTQAAPSQTGAATATITITDAPPSSDCVVPPLKRLTRKSASKLLKAFRCSTGKVSTKRKPKRGKLRVSSQKPKAGTRAPAGTKVAITLRRVR